MRIHNLAIICENTNEYLSSDDIEILANSIARINRLFKLNSPITLEFSVLSKMEPHYSMVYPGANAVTIGHSIYIFVDNIPEDLTELILHEYTHACIASRVRSACPLWLNEGLAVLLSGQAKKMYPKSPGDIDCFYSASYSTPYFYNYALYIVDLLVKTFTLPNIINALCNCTSFPDDSTLGIAAIKELTDANL